MQVKTIEFLISDLETIIIELNDPLETLYYCDQISTFFVKNNIRYLLSVDSLYDDMYVFRNLLDSALINQLHLDPSIQHDIGYLFNEECEDRPGLTYEKLEGRDHWVGFKYLLWGSEFAAWLYNKQNSDEIVFQITPLYPEVFAPEEQVESITSYDEWITHYQSLFTAIIPKDIAHKWREEANKIVLQIEQNGRT